MSETPQNDNKLGCYYLLTFYPSNLLLNDNIGFKFELENHTIVAVVFRHLKGLIVTDFDNQLIAESIDEKKTLYTLQKPITLGPKSLIANFDDGNFFAYDYEKYEHKEFYNFNYTNLVIVIECIKDVENIKLANKALDHFIDCYRLVSNDIVTLKRERLQHFSFIRKSYFHEYTAEELLLPTDVRMQIRRELAFSLQQIDLPNYHLSKRFETDINVNTTNLKNYFAKNSYPDPVMEYIRNAREELHIHKNNKYSFIESWTALEISIVSILTKIKLSRGISKNKIKEFEGEVGVSYLINIEFPLIYNNQDEAFKTLLSSVNVIRKKRNKVIHENAEVTKQDAEDALKTAIDFLNYFGVKRFYHKS